MNKDAILATLIGFGIGLLITGALLVGPTLVKNLPQIKLPTISLQTQNPTPTSAPTPTQVGVSIESPLAEAIETSDILLVSGKAPVGATVVIAGAVDETVVTVKEDGKFAGKVSLVEGKNDLIVTSYVQAQQTSQTVTVYYTPEEL